MLKRENFRVRDPFIFVHGGRYYLYANRYDAEGRGSFVAYASDDLENWEEPVTVFMPGSSFWGKKDFFAPELHVYKGAFYLFASFMADGRHRATSILKSDSPIGPFIPWGDEQITPMDWQCLDGTLYVDENGKPWTVYCREWTQVGDGLMYAAALKDDLSGTVGEPLLLFRASDTSWVRSIQGEGHFVTDGPWLYRSGNGYLNMLWSTFGDFGYGVARAFSRSGSIQGPWEMQQEPVYSQNGGHCMLFTDLEGQLRMSLHGPNIPPRERAIYLNVSMENDGSIRLL